MNTDKLAQDLPTEVVSHELSESERICPDCGEKLHVMAHESRHKLVIIPTKTKIREHVRHIYSYSGCEKNAVKVPVVKSVSMPPGI